MAYRVVDKYVGGKGVDKDNPADDADYETQVNVADFVHHNNMMGIAYTVAGGQGYGAIDGLGAAQGAAVSSTAPHSWDAWRAASPGASMWNEWKSTLQTDRDTITEVFDADTQTYTRTIDWDSAGNYTKYNEINALMLGAHWANAWAKHVADGGTKTNTTATSADSDMTAWLNNNVSTRRIYRVNVSKGNV